MIMYNPIRTKVRHITDMLLGIDRKATELSHIHDRLAWMVSDQLVLEILNCDEKFNHVNCLNKHGFKVYSQNEEDGLIQRILDNVGRDSRTFVEFGIGTGLENNTVYLLLNGWRGTWIEGNPEHVAKSKCHFERLVASYRLNILNRLITAENIEGILEEAGVPDDLELLSIDIDGNDYWVWKAITRYRPRVVIIEYNAGMGPSADWKMYYNPDHVWNGSRNFGASLKAMELLGREKGYVLIGCNLTGTNAFFVRSDLNLSKFLEPFTSERHFQPPRYYLRFFPGHPVDPAEIAGFQ